MPQPWVAHSKTKRIYGFSLTALKLIHNYLSNRKQRTKINLTCNSLQEIIFGVPQGSILGSLLFSIFLIDLFIVIEDTDIGSYVDDNTPYVIAYNIDGVIKYLEEASEILFKWFNDNLMKINADKCHLLVSTDNTFKTKIGAEFDRKLSFDYHISELCKKASTKIHALSRVALIMNISKMSSLNHNLAIVPLYACVS